MNKSFFQSILHEVRERTPLFLRQKIGPLVALVVYHGNFLFNRNKQIPKVLSIEETLDLVISKNLSVIRFGDGEISLIDGINLGFQKSDMNLSSRLEEIIKLSVPGLLICIPGIWDGLDKFIGVHYQFHMHHLYRYGHIWKKLLSYDTTYGDTHITRPYLLFVDKSHCAGHFNKLFSIWENKEVVLVEGEKSRLGVGNDMFAKVKSLRRILCPPSNAWDKYDIIKSEVLKINKDQLILISLGPTAKVLAHDLFRLGYRVIDIGHVDMEYEMFLRKADIQTKVRYKYFNEINERNPEECFDNSYVKQIISIIK